jgi:hypothetical protein
MELTGEARLSQAGMAGMATHGVSPLIVARRVVDAGGDVAGSRLPEDHQAA